VRSVALALGLLSLVACSAPEHDTATPAVTGTPLAAIQTRDLKVTWFAAQRLRIEDTTGAVLADGVTTGDLERIDPFLHAACTRAVAGPFLDARGGEPPVRAPLLDPGTASWSGSE
jgi:hypothetical protein